MKKFILVLLFFSFYFSQAQNGTEKISINFKDLNKAAVIKLLEKQTNYTFFFINDWLDDTPISGQFNDTSLTTVLESIFKDTVLNYYISPDFKIILTRSTLVYDSLPSGFFETKKATVLQDEVLLPNLYTEDTPSKKATTIRIGKENKTSSQKLFTLSGYVRNAVNGDPINSLVLSVRGKNINTVTDNKGFYTIKLPAGLNIIEVKSLGIEDSRKRVIIYKDGVLNLDLNESSELLEELIIEADKDRNIKEAITGAVKIQVEQIKTIPLILGERDILRVATSLPSIKTAGEGAAGFNVRGGKEDQNLFLLDNAVLYNPSHFFGIFSALNPFTTGDVNIFTGSIPAEYGGRLSSVFEINTKDGNDQKFSGEVSLGPVTSNVTLETPVIKDKASLIVGGRGTYSDWILKSLDEESLKNSKASFYDLILKYSHKIDKKNKLEVSGYYSDDKFSITSDSLFNYNNRLVSLKWNHKFNDKSQADLILSNSDYKFDIEFDGNSNKDFDFGYKINETEIKLKMKYLYNDKHKFNYGLSTKLYKTNPGSIVPRGAESELNPLVIPEERALESAFFISDNFEVTDKLLLNMGFRYSLFSSLGKSSQRIYAEGLPRTVGTVVETLDFDKNEVIKTYSGPELRVSARYFLSPSFSVKASFNNTYQYIHTLSNNTTASPTDTWKLSDLNIKPQNATQYALGFYKNLDDTVYELSLEGYYKKSENILDYKVGANLLLNESIETEVLQGEGKAYGIEFLLKKNKGKLNGWLAYSYSRSLLKLDSKFSEERVNGGDFFPANFDKPHDVNLVANYKLTKRFSLSANFTYQTGRPITFPVGRFIFNGSEQILFSDRNKFRIPDYYRFDIGFNIEGNHRIKKFAHSFWNISIYNVLGRNNPYSIFFVTDNGEVKAFKNSIFGVPVPTITYNFKF